MDETGPDCVLCLDGMEKQQGWVCDVGGRGFGAGPLDEGVVQKYHSDLQCTCPSFAPRRWWYL
jgi:hypothetical protein